jgi:flagellin-specific chaperone FliS
MKSIAQLEHADAYSDPLPCESTLDRMRNLFMGRQLELVTIKNKQREMSRLEDLEMQMSDRYRYLSNQMTQAELRLANNLREIVSVAGQIRDEYAAVEIVGETI